MIAGGGTQCGYQKSSRLTARGLHHKPAALVCGASAQNQATKLFRFFSEDDGYNETFAAAKW